MDSVVKIFAMLAPLLAFLLPIVIYQRKLWRRWLLINDSHREMPKFSQVINFRLYVESGFIVGENRSDEQIRKSNRRNSLALVGFGVILSILVDQTI